MKKNNIEEVKNSNRLYFKSLADTRASVGMLLISWAGALILGIEIIIFYYYFGQVAGVSPFSNWFFDTLVISTLYLSIVFFLPLLGTFVYRRQVFSTALLWLAYMGIYFSLQLLMLLIMVSSISTREFTIAFPRYSSLFIPYLFVISGLGFVYHYFWLKKQLKVGFSSTRTVKNYFAKVSVRSRNSFLIIFGCSLVGGLVSGRLMLVFGVLGSLLFSYAFSQLLTEVAYLLYLKRQSKDYWEAVPEESFDWWSVIKKIDLKNAKIRIFIEVLCFATFLGILGMTGYSEPGATPPLWIRWLGRGFVYLIGLDFFGSAMRLVVKKRRFYQRRGEKK